ncbi:type I-E CRISPR-associated protein Cas6/Cse3/CasE [Tsukamurella sp. NPDC003166]|uniref:type I-E CRISPR-associated protein Cas6/Cse3/CasE n=1 Tax=Tsukamurella sp. NPDC003166 TaxID=3154444 RepID=UPI0033A7E26E
MFMSRIAINSRRRGAVKLLANRHAMHAAVMSSFAPGTPTESENGRVLWRVDRIDHSVDLLIVSPERPCLAHIAEQAGWSTDNTWATREYAPFLTTIEAGANYAFRLTANPTHRVTTGTTKQIVGHKTVEHQRNWLVEKSEEAGFTILPSVASTVGGITAPALTLSDRDHSSFTRNRSRVTLTTTTYDGALTVTDADAFRHTLGHGLGRAKGYGCGLLTVLPLPTS